ncbi:MAG: methyl-accepting chemotaxis protein [Oscillospiraceae bacterium]|nr:methyl-accepting chemotaxis protein [Oscillospiraceae bacterium]
MKDLSVSKKLIVGFGVAIVLMIVILAVTIVTSLTRANDLNRISAVSDFQTEINSVRSSIYKARIEFRTVYSKSVGNDAEYALAVGYLNDAVASLGNAIKVDADRLDGQDAVPLNTLKTLFTTYLDANANVHASDLRVREFVDEMAVAGETMSDSSTNMAMQIFSALTSGLNTAAEVQARIPRAEMAQGVNDHVATARMLARALTLMNDGTAIPGIKAEVDAAITTTNELIPMFSFAETRAVAQKLVDALVVYDDVIDRFGAELYSNESIVANARTIADELLAVCEEHADEADGELVELINANIATSQVVMVALIVIVLFAILISVIMALLITKSITGPLANMNKWLKQAGETGNLSFADSEWATCDELAKSKDEIGQSLKSFAQFMRQVVYYSETVKTVADRDLTVKVKVLGEQDTIGNSLTEMVKELSDMFGEIKTSSEQVTVGAQQIADGAQTLAQGATEQAASVQELSSSISEVANKTQDNAKLANRAADLSATVRDNAQKGTEQMDAMMSAVKEINDASNEINQVIKVIDNIAFQTNILALNAAVEAARAGQHGKGFAVVAEEVRSLAAKSADAAKDTGALIENSIEKATLGARIADETSASLAEIVNGINESTEIVRQIAESSEEQSSAIKEINKGIDQVAQVVQSNSATAEESAAASEEMSGQSSILNELIGRFKIGGTTIGGGSKRAALPKAGSPAPAPKRSASSSFASQSSYSASDDSSDFSSGDSFGKY